VSARSLAPERWRRPIGEWCEPAEEDIRSIRGGSLPRSDPCSPWRRLGPHPHPQPGPQLGMRLQPSSRPPSNPSPLSSSRLVTRRFCGWPVGEVGPQP